ncbi:MAG: iron chelate uptake ABC transporter family permease subunit [Pseudomonadota bacterium]
MDFIEALTHYQFLQRALIAGLLAAVGCGLIGTWVVVKRISFVAGGIAHAVLGGMGAALFFGFAPTAGALAAAIFAALLIGLISLHWREREDTLISAIWAIGMAIGILFMAATPGYQVDLISYLFGNILMVGSGHLWIMIVLDLVLIITLLLFHRQFEVVVFDEEFALLRGVPVTFFYLLLLCLIAVTVVLLIQVVGLILVIALLTLPAAIAGQFVHTLSRMMILAILIGAFVSTTGLAISYQTDLPTGAIITLIAASLYLVATAGAAVRKQRQRRAAGNRAGAQHGSA